MALNNADCNLGQIDFEAAQNEVETTIQSHKKRGTYVIYKPKERFEISKNAVGSCFLMQIKIPIVKRKYCYGI